MPTDKRLRKGLDKLRDVVHQASTNPYLRYTLSQLEELVEEVSMEMERLPSYAHSKLVKLRNELDQIMYAIHQHKDGTNTA